MNIYKFRKQLKDAGFESLEVTCALCGKVHTGTTTWRTTRLDNNKEIVEGYYKPQLSIDERWELGWGEHDICTSRKRCEERQQQNRFRKHKLQELHRELIEAQRQLRNVLGKISEYDPDWLKAGSEVEEALNYAAVLSIDEVNE